MNPETRLNRLIPVAAALLIGASACSPTSRTNTRAYVPPPPLALVAIVDPSSGHFASQLRQVEDVIRANATPGEAVVVMFLQPSFGQTYVVRRGDSLSSIAKAHDLTLAALESANPQLGPLSGRNWKLIHPSEQVILPDGAAQNAFVLVSRAPAGPAPPELIALPKEPGHPTEFQRAQYQHALDKANTTNAARIAAWQAEAAKSVEAWQAQVISQLEKRSAASMPPTLTPNSRMLSASLTAGLTTLQGLDGRRLLLLLGGGELGPGSLAPSSVKDVNLVIANLSDNKAAAAWTAAGSRAGAASVKALDPALTRLQLAQVVNPK